MTMDPRDRAALLMALVIGAFILGSLIVVFVLALRGVGLPDVWDSLFGLVVAALGVLGGWLGANAMAKRNGNGRPPGEPPVD